MIFGFPCRFPARPSIFAVVMTQSYDLTRFFRHDGYPKKDFPGFSLRGRERERPARLLCLVLISAVSAVVPLAHAQLLTHRDLSYAMAKTIAETAIDSCAAKGYAVSAVVVDRAGEVIVAMRADNAGPHTMENARRKAYTARSFRTSTTAYAKRFADNDPVVHQQVTLPNVIAIPGGLPVKVGDEVIAGVGVSGSPGVDEPCVQAGLDKVADQLK
jgi:uncharacterized protein GlcG (DUF336 family)